MYYNKNFKENTTKENNTKVIAAIKYTLIPKTGHGGLENTIKSIISGINNLLILTVNFIFIFLYS